MFWSAKNHVETRMNAGPDDFSLPEIPTKIPTLFKMSRWRDTLVKRPQHSNSVTGARVRRPASKPPGRTCPAKPRRFILNFSTTRIWL